MIGGQETPSQPLGPFLAILGKRLFWAFFLITFLSTGTLAAINLASKYAIKLYTEDQLEHLPWDAVLYQNEDVPDLARVSQEVGKVATVTGVHRLGLLRMRLTPSMPVQFGQQDAYVSWLSLISATELRVLPPVLRPTGSEVVVGLVGPQKVIRPYVDRVAAGSRLALKLVSPGAPPVEVFGTDVGRVVHVDRLELVKWIMREVGSAAFIPQQGVLIVLPDAEFAKQAGRLTRFFDEPGRTDQVSAETHELSTLFTPEVEHLISIDRSALVTGWDLEGSRARVSDVIDAIRASGEKVAVGAGVNSDLLATLDKMVQKSRLVSVATLLVSVPLLWMAWVFAWNLAGLVALNERRIMGLFRLRGAAADLLERGSLVAIGLGGLLGGIAGLLVGTAVPLIGYRLGGTGLPLHLLLKVQDPWALGLFVVVSALLGLVAGKRVTDFATNITPREAAARVNQAEVTSFNPRLTWFQMAALLVGGGKLAMWIAGWSPQQELLQRLSALVGFISVPLFIYGCTAFLITRPRLVRYVLTRVVAPVAGHLRWFVTSTLLVRRHRISNALLVAALMFCISFFPSIMVESFQDRMMRGVRVNAGADLGVAYAASALTSGGDVEIRTVQELLDTLGRPAAEIKARLERTSGVDAVDVLYEMVLPQVYVKTRQGLPLYLTSPGGYLGTVYYEEQLATGARFGDTIGRMGDEFVASVGLSEMFDLPIGKALSLSQGPDGPDTQIRIGGIVSQLPGAPSVLVGTRESYAAAEVDFIEKLTRSNPFAVADIGNRSVAGLDAMPSSVVMLVRKDATTAPERLAEAVAETLGGLPFRYDSIRDMSRDMVQMRKDMFVSLAVENIKVYLIGGLLISLAGVLAIFITNFLEERRTFALLRVRGGAPSQHLRLSMSNTFAPVLIGAAIGLGTALPAGYGLATEIFRLSGGLGDSQALPVHLTVTPWTFISAGILIVFFGAVSLAFSVVVFRRTAREGLTG